MATTAQFVADIRAEDPTLSDQLREDLAHDLMGAPKGTYPGLRWYHQLPLIIQRHTDDSAGLEAILDTYEAM